MAAKRKKILIITDDAGESYEILYAKHRFEEQGWITHIGATKKKRLNGVIHDFEPGWNTYIERPGYLIKADVALKDVKASDYQAVLLIGGRAPEFLRHNSNLLDLIRNFNKKEKWIFSICHGIQIMIAAGITEGRNLTCYCNIQFEVEQAGAKWINMESVVDGNFITAQTWESHPEFYRDIFRELNKTI
ncbi:MAG: DJ-1/PfpI family protein [Verrucomicrobiota bacterium]|nr:DJ-1/PfpI family protein [Verrucomicrobiota bacterium]